MGALFAREHGRLRRLLALRARGELLRRVDLDDLVQETYLEAMRRFDSYSYRGRDSFFRWLAALALHRVANLRRMNAAEKRDRRRETPLRGPDTVIEQGGSNEPTASGPGPRTLISGNDEERRFENALAELSPVDREVIGLARIEGLPLAEVAQRMGRSRNAVALLLSRALRKLRQRLDSPS